jgi:hypothetical protein
MRSEVLLPTELSRGALPMQFPGLLLIHLILLFYADWQKPPNCHGQILALMSR